MHHHPTGLSGAVKVFVPHHMTLITDSKNESPSVHLNLVSGYKKKQKTPRPL